ncbi:MAG: tRNA-dihydrouridine synthase [Parcubacteria group bacterium]|nr:tRNA-dihydrouridine synthase [Parcubacteria group bacterium]
MKSRFWEKLKKPIFALAPMADVTDAAFRQIIAKYGKPDIMFTEFTSADGLFLADKTGREKLMKDLLYTESERPIVAQFFTAKPEMMERAATLAVELGFDGVDINMGCPDRGIEKQGAGAALIKTPALAREIIQAAKKGAGDLSVSIKTRIGYSKNEIETWLPELLKEEPVAVTLHARTQKEMSKVPAHWDVVSRAVEIRDELKSKTLILGNGDVLSLEEARQKAKETGADGIMLGKAIFGNPFLFCGNLRSSSVNQRLQVMVEHTKLFDTLLSGVKNFSVMKKHYKAYANGFDGAKELRMKLMETQNADEVENITTHFLDSL